MYVFFPTRNNRVLACVARGQTRTHARTAHTRIHHYHLRHSSVRSCKTEENVSVGAIVVTVLLPFTAVELNTTTMTKIRIFVIVICETADMNVCGFPIVLLGSSSAESNPVVNLPEFATFNAQSTRHEASPGPNLAPWCTDGPPCVPRSRKHEKRPMSAGENVKKRKEKKGQ